MKSEVRLLSHIIIVINTILLAACLTSQATGVPATLPSEFMFPDDVLEFHIHQQRAGKVFVLTVYQEPFPGHFQYMRLTNDNQFELVNSYSRTSSKGIVSGTLTVAEREEVGKVLHFNPKNSVVAPQTGDLILTLSYDGPDGVGVFSCTAVRCPVSLCAIYDLTNTIINRSDKSYFAELVCPIQGDSMK